MSQSERGSAALMLWDAGDRYADRPAVLHGSEPTSYGALLARAAAIGRALHDTGVVPADRVAVFLDGGADAIAAVFGILSVGAAAVVINENLRPRQIEYMLDHAGARVLL